MQYLRLGSSGQKVSRLCLGCMSFGGAPGGYYHWTLNYEDSKPIILRAIDLGINFFDTADVYSDGRSEKVLGKVVEGRRDDLIIATKVFGRTGTGPNDAGLSRKHVRHQVKGSLDRLRTKYLDLYQVHRWDYETPIEETLRTFHDLVHVDGVVNYIGASAMWAWQLGAALDMSERLGLEKFVTIQNHYNLAYREEEREMIPLCLSRGIGIMPWSPLARGFLTGKYNRGAAPKGKRYRSDYYLKERYFKPEDFDVVTRLSETAKDKGTSSAKLALAWLLHKPGVVSPIVGVTSRAQLDELIEATEIKISPKEMRRLEEPYQPHAVEGHT
ncbi:MAG: aldo/keto reductase [Thaumarchaeota archaeon]|nr:aldo/keto reductase [Nitrososphaerota archaeon]